ncbi:Lytic transglycosylase catalytic [Rhodobacter ferrooxidans]|uniref:Lytic transglycosylase catalytic n=2 Tax=Rhodobacter ferrooxidans TaxID=371731 RepID=C8S2N3_9RHOB|nr:transglycosylase SLT domain-containing protein [Rhodobacter sp. SW2]EEW24709.1 Lytic transglycosylase catalytic [Rhodobacter sp. SW2]
MRIAVLTSGLVLALAACVPVKPEMAQPVMGWDHRPEAAEWTVSTMQAVAAHDTVLAASQPSDIRQWCPGYPEANLTERRAFWVAMLSAVAKYESSWNPKAAGGGGAYIGVMQISPATARHFGCEAQSSAALKDGAANLECAVKIMADQVGNDQAVVGNGRQGLGRDWMPFRKADKRAAMAAWVGRQSYCN